MDSKSIKIEITNNEALVLYEFLSRYSDTEKLSIEHPAEKQALLNLACVFEKNMPEPFEADYIKTLKSARRILQNDT